MSRAKVRGALSTLGSVALATLVLATIVWVRASKDADEVAFGAQRIDISSNWTSQQRDTAGRSAVADADTASAVVARRIGDAALEQTRRITVYDASYQTISYPGGDVSPDRGVCSDVVVRAFRQVGLDLQKEVHEDMSRAFSAYPQRWGLSAPDANIDHRRVANLMTFFDRNGASVAVTRRASDYRLGDVVAWDLGRGILHIGVVTGAKGSDGPLVVHNIGAGPRAEDVLFAWSIIGHYRWPAP